VAVVASGPAVSCQLADGWTVVAPADAPLLLGALRAVRRERRRCGSELRAREMALLDVVTWAAGAAAASFASETAKPPPPPDPEVSGSAGEVTVTEAAAALDLSTQYVRRLVGDGRLAGRRTGRAWAIDAATVGALVMERMTADGGEAG
jgi:excisionase family DNA binding protein